MEEQQHFDRWESYVDWGNRPALNGSHGGMLAALFVFVVEILENLAYLANASNLVRYMSKFMHFSTSRAANNVTNFMGTAFFLALLGGFLADAFFTTYHVYLMSAVIELLGLVILTVQARSTSLKPQTCDSISSSTHCEEVNGGQAAMLFGGLYLVALGVGGIKGSLPVHGAEQFNESTPQGRKNRSTFFNYFVFSLACGALIAVTLVVWVEDNKGWEWGFGISTMAILLSILVFLAGSTTYRNKIPSGSPLTTIFKVLIAAMCNASISRSNKNIADEESREESNVVVPIQTPTKGFKYLNKAIIRKPFHPTLECTVKQVEEVKQVLRILPIFACTIVLNCCLAQLSTFSVEQAATMNTKLGSLKVPPASLPIFPVLFIMILAPVYDHVMIPIARSAKKTEMGISHLQRIGIGLILSIIAMAIAALVEVKRKRVAFRSKLQDSDEPLPITFFWVALQYLFLGSADLFTLAGLLEFFFTEAPSSMRSLATSLSFVSLAMGYYLSSVLVSIINSVTNIFQHKPWLSGSNLNYFHLERFYWLMCVLSGLNFLHYLLWAKHYQYKSTKSGIEMELEN